MAPLSQASVVGGIRPLRRLLVGFSLDLGLTNCPFYLGLIGSTICSTLLSVNVEVDELGPFLSAPIVEILSHRCLSSRLLDVSLDVGPFVVGRAVQDVRQVDRDGPGRKALGPEAQACQARRVFVGVGREHERLQGRETNF